MNETTPIVPEELHSQLEAVERYVNAAEAAKFLSINRRTLLQMAREGVVPGHPLGNGPRRIMAIPSVGAGLVDAQPRKLALPSVLSE